MTSVPPSRGRPRSRQQGSAFAKASPSRTRSPPRRSISPRSASRSRSRPRSVNRSPRGDKRNGWKGGKSRSRSPRRSVAGSRSPAGRDFRARSYSRSMSRGSPPPKSSKVRTKDLPLFFSWPCDKTDHFQIVVEKLTKNVNENHLHEIFGAYGAIKDLELPMNRQCKQPFTSIPRSDSLIRSSQS